MTGPDKREILETIIRDSLRLRDLAKASEQDFLAYLLETVLHEARSTLIGQGYEPPVRAPSGEARSSRQITGVRATIDGGCRTVRSPPAAWNRLPDVAEQQLHGSQVVDPNNRLTHGIAPCLVPTRG